MSKRTTMKKALFAAAGTVSLALIMMSHASAAVSSGNVNDITPVCIGSALTFAAETNEGDQEDRHTSPKKCRKRGSKGLAVSCSAIDDEECVSVESEVVRRNELKVPRNWHSQHGRRGPAKDGQPLWRNGLEGKQRWREAEQCRGCTREGGSGWWRLGDANRGHDPVRRRRPKRSAINLPHDDQQAWKRRGQVRRRTHHRREGMLGGWRYAGLGRT